MTGSGQQQTARLASAGDVDRGQPDALLNTLVWHCVIGREIVVRRRLWLSIVAVLFAVNAAAENTTQRNSANGVTFAVTPRIPSAHTRTWDFLVVMDTHDRKLTDDLAASAVLLDGAGNEVKPLAWKGAAPGGRHRAGVLKFNPISPRPEILELRITRPGEAEARVFRWPSKDGHWN